MSLLALIPARGGSKGIPRKNIRSFSGKPLLQWTIEAALMSSSVDHVVVSTDDPEIADIARACGAQVPFLRPLELASDAAPAIGTVLHALAQLPKVCDILLLQPTSPLRSVEDIQGIIKLYRDSKIQSIVSVSRSHKHPAWMYSLSSDNILQALAEFPVADCRQQLPPAYVLNGALYLASRTFLERHHGFLSSNTMGFVMPPERSVDIDTLIDWRWGEFLLQYQHHDLS